VHGQKRDFGFDAEDIAYILGLTKREFDELRERQPQVAQALRRGQARCTLDVATKVIMQARKGDFKAAKLYLETRGKWIKPDAEKVDANDTLEDMLEALADEEERKDPKGGTTPSS